MSLPHIQVNNSTVNSSNQKKGFKFLDPITLNTYYNAECDVREPQMNSALHRPFAGNSGSMSNKFSDRSADNKYLIDASIKFRNSLKSHNAFKSGSSPVLDGYSQQIGNDVPPKNYPHQQSFDPELYRNVHVRDNSSRFETDFMKNNSTIYNVIGACNFKNITMKRVGSQNIKHQGFGLISKEGGSQNFSSALNINRVNVPSSVNTSSSAWNRFAADGKVTEIAGRMGFCHLAPNINNSTCLNEYRRY